MQDVITLLEVTGAYLEQEDRHVDGLFIFCGFKRTAGIIC